MKDAGIVLIKMNVKNMKINKILIQYTEYLFNHCLIKEGLEFENLVNDFLKSDTFKDNYSPNLKEYRNRYVNEIQRLEKELNIARSKLIWIDENIKANCS